MREIEFRAWDTDQQEMFIPSHWFVGDLANNTTTSIIMQYTGLKDKNRKKIYEGDIVRLGVSCISTVEFTSGAFCYRELMGALLLGGLHSESIEVIGNIHENPELLEAK